MLLIWKQRISPLRCVQIQSTPNAPDPSGLNNLLNLLGKGDSFKDITGLEGNQKNALETLKSSLDTAKSFGEQASKLAIQGNLQRKYGKSIEAN